MMHIILKDPSCLKPYARNARKHSAKQIEKIAASIEQFGFNNALSQSVLMGCYTLMIGFNRPWTKPWIAAKVHASPVEWIAINSTKPGRDRAVTSIVVHSNNEWAEKHINDDVNEKADFLRRECQTKYDIKIFEADYFACHRWRYAVVGTPLAHDPFIDTESGLASGGDWCTTSRRVYLQQPHHLQKGPSLMYLASRPIRMHQHTRLNTIPELVEHQGQQEGQNFP